MAAELRGEANYIQRQVARPGAVRLQTEEDAEDEDSSIPDGATEN